MPFAGKTGKQTLRRFDEPGRSPVYATNAAAATSHPLATQTAMTILREGGNAVDAAIAAAATLCVVEPHMTGIGGDCFAIVCEPDGSLHGLNGSGRAAQGADLGWYLENGFSEIPGDSIHSVTVPGAVRAWEALHGRFGSMDFTRLFADAVQYGREGYPVAPRVAHDWATLVPKLSSNEGGLLHCLKDGRAPVAGQMMAAPALADVLAGIAAKGSPAFYEGEVAADIARTVQEHGGFITEADIAATKPDWVDPVSTRFMSRDVFEIPPNGQGIIALVLMRMLERLGIPEGAASGERLHLELEAGRIAYAVRDAHVADPAHMSMTAEDLLTDAHIEALCGQYDPAMRNDAIRLPDMPDADTVYLSVVDRERRCVSFINSLYGGFGCGIVTPKTGIALQNRGSCFVVKEGHPNAIGPGKRSMHTIIPGMAMKDGLPEVCFGVMGGSYQAMGHAHVLANMFRYGMDPQEALDDPRLFWDDAGNATAEPGLADGAVEYLQGRGHRIVSGGPFGGGQIIRIDNEQGVLVAASDPRKDGHAAGF